MKKVVLFFLASLFFVIFSGCVDHREGPPAEVYIEGKTAISVS